MSAQADAPCVSGIVKACSQERRSKVFKVIIARPELVEQIIEHTKRIVKQKEEPA